MTPRRFGASDTRPALLRGDAERGIAVASAAILAFGAALIVALLVSQAYQATDSSSRDRSWERALFSAEAGLDDALTRIADNPSYATVGAGTDLSTRSAIITAADSLASDPFAVETTPSGDYVIVKAAGSEVAYAVGFSPGIGVERRQVRVVRGSYSTTSQVGCWPDAALIGNGLVEVGSGTSLDTVPSTRHVASAIGNSDFKGASGIWVDGDVMVPGSASNTSPGDVFGTIDQNAEPLAFPSLSELTSWQTELRNEAQAGGTSPALSLSGPYTLTAPVLVTGDIILHSGADLTINGSGPVYVEGLVELKGGILKNGALLAIEGQFKVGGGTEYQMTGPDASAGLVSFLTDKDAVEIGSGTSGHQGVVYAARGGVKFAGSPRFQGAAIAGGDFIIGTIKTGGGTTIAYPASLLPSATWLPDVTGGPYATCASSGGGDWFADAAIVATGDVKLSGGGCTVVEGLVEAFDDDDDPECDDIDWDDLADDDEADECGDDDDGGCPDPAAHVYTGGKFEDGTASVHGDVLASQSIKADTIVGDSTSGASGHVSFPDAADIEEWRTELRTAAQAGTTTGSLSYGSDVTLTTPLYVDGDLTMSGETLTLTGGDVLYVTGKLTVSGGGTLRNDGIVVADDQLKFSGGGQYIQTGTVQGTAVVGFASSDKALELSGGSVGSEQGIAYAPYGGIKLSGGSIWTGALFAGGGADGKVELSGGSMVIYPPGLGDSSPVLPGGDVTPPEASSGVFIARRSEV